MSPACRRPRSWSGSAASISARRSPPRRTAAGGNAAGDVLDAVVAKDIAQKFDGFGNDAATYFEGRARFMSVAIAIVLAFIAHVDAVDLFHTYLSDPNVRAKVIERSWANADRSAIQGRQGSDRCDEQTGAGRECDRGHQACGRKAGEGLENRGRQRQQHRDAICRSRRSARMDPGADQGCGFRALDMVLPGGPARWCASPLVAALHARQANRVAGGAVRAVGAVPSAARRPADRAGLAVLV